MILLDTNVLGRMTDSTDPNCAISRQSVHTLLARKERLVIVPQNLYEFWAVATRKSGPPPAGQNGLGMSPRQASQWVYYFQRRFTLLPDRADLVDHWLALVLANSIHGLKSHDARLIAAMQTHGIARILTFNTQDFRGFSVTILEPSSV
ncbi:MAG: type II toxin-antitoxin system VapC family toxin [Planctomycetes bacterium]|nr:type II toxin-antitoxin system VapC family toxin [Planctomycetota bacterium]